MPCKVYCTAALTSLSDSVSYITFLFSEWRIRYSKIVFIRHTVPKALVKQNIDILEYCCNSCYHLVPRDEKRALLSQSTLGFQNFTDW